MSNAIESKKRELVSEFPRFLICKDHIRKNMGHATSTHWTDDWNYHTLWFYFSYFNFTNDENNPPRFEALSCSRRPAAAAGTPSQQHMHLHSTTSTKGGIEPRRRSRRKKIDSGRRRRFIVLLIMLPLVLITILNIVPMTENNFTRIVSDVREPPPPPLSSIMMRIVPRLSTN